MEYLYYVASIRPRPFSRGNIPIITILTLVQAVLQFGHDLSAVETTSADSAGSPPTTLQFGHDLSAVETGGDAGNGAGAKVVLQFGHDLSAVETP